MFSKVRNDCKRLARANHQNYLAETDDSLRSNPKRFWSLLREVRSSTSSPISLRCEDEQAEEPQAIADLFADFFSSAYRKETVPAPVYTFGETIHLSSMHISANEVELKLKSLNISKSPGPDEIPAAALKFFSEVLAPHLFIYLNYLLAGGVFHSNLKAGYLIPIHKSDDKSLAKNYRPVVFQSSLAKVFESLVLDKLAFSFRNVITPQQHGFQKGRSTSTNLVVFMNNILNAFKNRTQLDI
ncbi:uncharacterized protein LOC124355703 [Homalodisca vitripennis]|uniref:uncharacterized protein LOC124355703 n=1 Tax=Homalodisca vitripennis TaxID=197043 RepID=UPI001EE9EC62|nr:uncharacterized protein LOC124355703 [Homalodisca vitripennis]